MTTANTTPQQWLDGFFRQSHESQPVNATFIGEHAHDHRLPDLSEAAVGDVMAAGRALLDGLPDAASGTDALDIRLAAGQLRIKEWEIESGHFHRRNPSFYTGEAVFGILSLFLSDFAPLGDRLEAATSRMHGVEALLAQARANVRAAPTHWTQRAIRECRSALAFLDRGLPHVTTGGPGLPDVTLSQVEEAAASAARSFSDHLVALETDLLSRSVDDCAAGEEAFALHLEQAHFLRETADEIATYAESEIGVAQRRVREEAASLGATSAADLLGSLADFRPDRRGYLARYAEEWTRMREIAVTRDLLTWPDFPIEYVARPEWARAAAPGLYFLFYRSPAASNRPPVHRYLVEPIGDDLSDEEAERKLRATNDSVIRLNHVIHHGGIGHHVQNWHAFRAESRVGRIAAVDCASRIAMNCGATMAEGWACYATDLMREVGALTPLEALAETNGRIRMCARAVVDVRLHQGRMSWDEAAAYYQRVAGMSEAAAKGEATKNSMFPGAALIYLMGTDAIHALRRTLTAPPHGWSLKHFHDTFLSHGSIPVALIARKMLEEAQP